MKPLNQRGKPGPDQRRAAAEETAVAALGFLATDPERQTRFLDVTGLDPGNLRKAAAAPAFLGSVLDYLASDESLLLAFAANAGRSPESVARDCAALAPRDTDFGA